MGIKVRNIDRLSALLTRDIDVGIITAVSQAGVKAASIKPGYAFEIVGVDVYALGVTAIISADAKISGVSVLTGVVTPVAATIVPGTLVSSVAGRRGSATDTIDVHYTTNGTGAATQFLVIVRYKPILPAA